MSWKSVAVMRRTIQWNTDDWQAVEARIHARVAPSDHEVGLAGLDRPEGAFDPSGIDLEVRRRRHDHLRSGRAQPDRERGRLAERLAEDEDLHDVLATLAQPPQLREHVVLAAIDHEDELERLPETPESPGVGVEDLLQIVVPLHDRDHDGNGRSDVPTHRRPPLSRSARVTIVSVSR